MVESTRPATWDDLLRLARDLAAEGARYALIGGCQFIVPVRVDDVVIPVLSLEGLLLTKEGMREKDRADRAVLLRALAAARK